MAKTTYLYHEALPDGFIMSFSAKGKPDGENGFMASAYKTMELDLQDERDNNSFASKMMVSSVLPTRDPITLDARMYSFKDKTTGDNIQLQRQSFVYNMRYLPDDMSPESWCRNQIRELKKKFKSITNLTYGGTASDNGWPPILSLDQVFLPADVAGLAYSLYEDEINDKSFFDNDDLVASYFKHTDNVFELFVQNGYIN